jgi:hypothetical protein
MKKITKKIAMKRAEAALENVNEILNQQYYDEDEFMYAEVMKEKVVNFINENK